MKLRWSVPRVFTLIVLLTSTAWACAVVPPPGLQAHIDGEDAIIVWDPTTSTEHFIRRATLSTNAASVGFLVPTPAHPQIESVEDAGLFDRLVGQIQPAQTLFHFGGLFVQTKGLLHGMQDVVVESVQRIGPFNVSTVQADNAAALAEWLKNHGFTRPPALESWLQPYVAKHWVINAFQVAKQDGKGAAGTGTVRLSFHIEQPFFPYSEPQPQRDDPDYGRALRLFFVSPVRMEGAVDGKPWRAKLLYSRDLQLSQLLGALSQSLHSPVQERLTAFYDGSPRTGLGDLVFSPSKDQSDFLPAKVDGGLFIPLDILFLAALVAFLVYLGRQRKK